MVEEHIDARGCFLQIERNDPESLPASSSLNHVAIDASEKVLLYLAMSQDPLIGRSNQRVVPVKF